MNIEPNENSTDRHARRNGNVARLPKKLRDLVNSMLDVGVAAAEATMLRINQAPLGAVRQC